MLLCDAAQEVGGKLYVLGGGWSVTGPGPFQCALALKIEVPWDRANQRHQLSIRLVDDDGASVAVPGPEGPAEVGIQGDFEVGRPPGLTPGVPLDTPMVVSLPPLALPPGRYTWVVEIDGESADHWRSSFAVRPAGPEDGPVPG
jgi:hypothetical protein